MPALTIADAVKLAAVVDLCQRGARVARVDEEGDIHYGIARSIGNESGGFLRTDADVTGAFVRVTLRSGFEAFWPIAEIMRDYGNGTFVEIRGEFPRD